MLFAMIVFTRLSVVVGDSMKIPAPNPILPLKVQLVTATAPPVESAAIAPPPFAKLPLKVQLVTDRVPPVFSMAPPLKREFVVLLLKVQLAADSAPSFKIAPALTPSLPLKVQFVTDSMP